MRIWVHNLNPYPLKLQRLKNDLEYGLTAREGNRVDSFEGGRVGRLVPSNTSVSRQGRLRARCYGAVLQIDGWTGSWARATEQM